MCSLDNINLGYEVLKIEPDYCSRPLTYINPIETRNYLSSYAAYRWKND